jgi:kexin
VSDQSNQHHGAFLGWSLALWGSTIDPSKVRQFSVSKLDNVFPPLSPEEAENHPVASSSIAQAATSTKEYAHPTSALPDNHGIAEGEAHQPAFGSALVSGSASISVASSGTAPASTHTGIMNPTADEGWFPDMQNLSSDKRWLGIAAGVALIFLASAGVFFWRRRAAARRHRAQYAAIAGDSSGLPMGQRGAGAGRGTGTGTKELYDAFGEVSDDDDEDADEETGLRPKRDLGPLGAHEVGYHSGFLDDDEANTPGLGGGSGYRDEPASSHQRVEGREATG